MTSPNAGRITVGLSIDGRDIGDQITDAISRHLQPALEKIELTLQKVQREYANTYRAADKSAARQVIANRRVVGSLRTIELALRRVEAGYERVALAAERSAARQVIANRAAAASQTGTGGGGPPRGGGSGGGGGGGTHRGGFMQGGKGTYGFLTSPVGLAGIGLGVNALPAATLAVTNLLGAIQALGQSAGVVPGVVAGVAASFGTMKLATVGLSDAIEAVWEAAKSGDAKDLEKATEALKEMAPAAAELATFLGKDLRPALVDIQKLAAQGVFEGITSDLRGLTDKALPVAQRGIKQVSSAWNNTLKELIRVGGKDETLSFVDRIFGNTAEAQNRANKAIEPFVSAIGKLTAESSDFLPRLADGLTKVGERFNNWITKIVDNGDLDRWINEGIEAVGHFGNALLNIGKILTSITKAAGGDGGFLKWLDEATEKLATFLASDEGQQKLIDFFNDARERGKEWLPVLKDLVSLGGDVLKAFDNWGKVILPILGTIADVLTGMPSLVTGVLTAFIAWKSISGIIGGIGGLLGKLPGQATGAATGINSALSKIVLPAALAPLLYSQTNGLQAPDASTGERLAGLGINVAGGAALGAQFGPWGIALGAMIGAGVTLFQSTKQRLDEAKAEWEKAWQEDHDAGPTREGSPEGQLAALPALRAQRLPSLYNPDGTLKPTGPDVLRQMLENGTIQGGYTLAPDGSTVLGPNGEPLITLPPPSAAVTPGATQYDPISGLPNNLPPQQLPGAQPPPNLPPAPRTVVNPPIPTPSNLPANTEAPEDLAGLIGAVPQASQQVQQLASEVRDLPEGEIKIKDPSPELLENLDKVDATITKVSDNEIVVKANTDEAQKKIDTFALKIKQQTFPLNFTAQVTPPNLPPAVVPQPRAMGGGIYGGIPGKDSVPALLMPGEHVLTTSDVIAMGGQAAVYAFRRGLHRYADGGEVPHLGTGALPGPGGDTVLGVLQQIRDLLAGKGGTSSNPLAATADAVSTLADQTTGSGATSTTGPFGTPIKPRHRGYEMAAAAIQALGGDPEKFLGADPATLPLSQGGILPNPVMAGYGASGAGLGGIASALAKFALSGDTADLPAGIGLNDSAVTAITAARNKKKGGLTEQQIADLVTQIFTGGGFSGVLDESNTSLIKSLTSARDRLAKQGGVAAGIPGVSGVGGVPMAYGGLDAFAASVSGGKYQWGASDLAAGLSDCSGAISDLVEIITTGQATSKRLFSTADAGSVLSSLGAVSGAVPGMLQIGWSDSHMRATLPSGVNFESGGGTGQGATYGGNAQGAAGMPNIMSLPVGALAGMAGLPGAGGVGGNPLGYTGSPVPVYIVNGPNGLGQLPGQLAGAGLGAAGTAGVGVLRDILGGSTDALLTPEGQRRPSAELAKLIHDRNPAALAALFGFDVQDFGAQGGGGDEVMKNSAAFDATGRLFSDTAALSDRTQSSLGAQIEDMKKQLVDITTQVADRLNDKALTPIIADGLQSGLNSLKDAVTASIGTNLGNAAAPPIADAVSSAVASLPIDNSGAGNVGGNAAGVVTGVVGMARGGSVVGGTPGIDSVPALLMPGEHVLSRDDVAAMGGQAMVYGFRKALQRGKIKGFATGGGVNVNDTVGAEFFGVSEVPIIGAIVNLLVKVLLKVIGVEIEARDTLMEMTDEFRGFRGDAFKAFDATGRLLNDTSALSERTQSSEQTAAAERIRILKIVIQALIKYIIEKVIVPIAKAVANAAIQAGASAAGAAVNTQAPGAGGIVSSLISSAGQAGVEIAAEVGTDFALAISETLIQTVAEGLQSYFPDLVSGVFGGGAIESLLVGPLTRGITDPILGAIGGLFSLLGGGLIGGAASLIPGLPFDSGGIARGTGMMPKAVIAPERVLGPRDTQNFEKLTDWLRSGGRPGTTVEIHAPFTVNGGEQGAREAHRKLLELFS
ncbi:tape measure protein [Mycobacterium phage Audrey]|uniref:Tape measure protein n=1 Tax=Mycobacterium phage Audrey TaxID=1458709 RepID=X2KSD1_9CAUD|nr:tape measure protein [Mycobacterium phage Audrey]